MADFARAFNDLAYEPPSSGPVSSKTGGGGGPVSSLYYEDEYAAPPPSDEPPAFNDIDGVAWARESILSLAEKGILDGRGNGVFDPNGNITREEFVKMLVLSFGMADPEAAAAFDDVPVGEWYYAYVASAAARGVVNGVSETRFGAGLPITREEMATMLFRVIEASGTALSGKNDAPDFPDADEISDWARETVGALQKHGIINGMGDGLFAPKNKLTRAEAAKALYGALALLNGGIEA
jgi:hypothetical protein